jgi:hypothetical protein
MMAVRVEALRAATLKNQLLWLASFGCQVARRGDVIHVVHSELPEYAASLIVGQAETGPGKLEQVLTQDRRRAVVPDIYVDNTAASPALHEGLTRHRFTLVGKSVDKGSVWRPGEPASGWSVRPASPQDADQWASLYSEGFARAGRDAKVDQVRWRLSFESSRAVQHWFIVRKDATVGVFQTCAASGVTGIYSFALNPAHRGLRKVLRALRAVRAGVTSSGQEFVYFERARSASLPNAWMTADFEARIIVIRTWMRYRHTSRKH